MAWISVDRDGRERIYMQKPKRFAHCVWAPPYDVYANRFYDFIELPKGSIKKLIGRELSWEDDCVELK